MNASQLHERLRVEISRRIDRGLLTGTLLARQTGLQSSHISNFLHHKRKLSLAAIDRILAAQMLSIEDLLPLEVLRNGAAAPVAHEGNSNSVPLVSQTTAAHSPSVGPQAILEMLELPAGILEQLRPRRTVIRRDWQRFLAVRVTNTQALPMAPILAPHAIAVLDRHYNSFASYQPPRPNLYAVSIGNALFFRYVSFEADTLVLRPFVLDYPVELHKIGPNDSPSDSIVGRVCVSISQV
jgi:Cro/C1-type HTH DNA-binding domain